MKRYGILILLWCVAVGTLTAQKKNVVSDFVELTDTKPIDGKAWDQCGKVLRASWGSVDVHYSKTNVPGIAREQKLWKETAWKGERVHAQAVVWGGKDCGALTPSVTDLTGSNGAKIPASAVQARFVRYVMTDELNKDKKGGCGYRPDRTQFDSSLVADLLDTKAVHDLKACNTQPLWVTVQVPAGTKPGTYKGKLNLRCAAGKLPSLDMEIRVLDRTLPAPKDWAFHLDLWQHPFAVARYHDVPLWSDEHMELMRPVMQILADAGQKVITTTLMYAPWGGQTYDKFNTMITRIRHVDGSWSFDYAVFDKWVEFMMGMGIDRQINCYSLIPWKLSFQYYDQASNSLKFLDTKVGTPEFNDYWTPFLKDFAAHLKQKGWFDITTIAMDERPMDAMQKVIRLIRDADPGYKIALAGNYHPQIEKDVYDYCVASGQFFPDDVLAARKQAGKVSTVYTCCTEPYPNTFTFSPSAESAWLPIYAAAKGFGGYLRWAYNSWTENPVPDSRFYTWAAGDCYLVYPFGRSSIRMERLVEGIQNAEKIRLLREEYKNAPAKLREMDEALKSFEIRNLPDQPAAGMVKKVKETINRF